MLVPRVAYEMEKTIIRTIAEGKDAVSPLMEAVPAGVLKGLTQGQTAATKLILESKDRFLGVQGYAGVGKTTQYRAVMRAIGTLRRTSARSLSAWARPPRRERDARCGRSGADAGQLSQRTPTGAAQR
ncbi:AAA family ATPase [Lelliottia sp. WB101]|uniref:AAA family ATPase n=1 Tax=Lelliottia sp. WB101 TaxID=2153385 RepID=UPI00131F396E|nr:AAA family ATPase [Lelliottia sp. WB101]